MVVLFGIVILCLFVSCGGQVNHHGRTPLVEVSGRYLYAEDLKMALPDDISRDDSVLFAEYYIRNWVEDVLLLDNAERNVSGAPEIEELVAAYRHSLVLHLYQEQLMEQQLGREIKEEQIDSFYRNNENLFLLEEPLAKGLYIKVPLKDAGVKNVRKWYAQTDREVLEKLEKYSLQHAAAYLYFYDQGMPLADVVEKIPLQTGNPVYYVCRNPHLEVRDTAFDYFLHVDSQLKSGQQKPLGYAAGEIREILMNVKRADFMKRIKGRLYKEAQDDRQITYYY